eukprot:TRINITY_DN22675_c0_g1_i1.p1 TRINITY_DN22675_c0_g1~~TRINITY_DN22675_c0_g1_i1.p1  ORF type:complete len:1699 (+),score=588.47 TRINITY_DN22675_c0_g1_i1:78-5174(+)
MPSRQEASEFAQQAKKLLDHHHIKPYVLVDLKGLKEQGDHRLDRVDLVKNLLDQQNKGMKALERLQEDADELDRLEQQFIVSEHERCNSSMHVFMGLLDHISETNRFLDKMKHSVVHMISEMGGGKRSEGGRDQSISEMGYPTQLRHLFQRRAKNGCKLQLVRAVSDLTSIDTNLEALRQERHYLALSWELRRYDEVLAQWPQSKDGKEQPELSSIYNAVEERLAGERVSELVTEITRELAENVLRTEQLSRGPFAALMAGAVRAQQPPLPSTNRIPIQVKCTSPGHAGSVSFASVPFHEGVPLWDTARCSLRSVPAELDGGTLLRGPKELPLNQAQVQVSGMPRGELYCVTRPGYRDGGLGEQLSREGWACLKDGRPGGRLVLCGEDEDDDTPPWSVYCKSIDAAHNGSASLSCSGQATFFLVFRNARDLRRRALVAALHALGVVGFPQRDSTELAWAAEDHHHGQPKRHEPPLLPHGPRWRLVEATDELFDEERLRRRVVSYMRDFVSVFAQWQDDPSGPARGHADFRRERQEAAGDAPAAERHSAGRQRPALERCMTALLDEMGKILANLLHTVTLVRERAFPFLDDPRVPPRGWPDNSPRAEEQCRSAPLGKAVLRQILDDYRQWLQEERARTRQAEAEGTDGDRLRHLIRVQTVLDGAVQLLGSSCPIDFAGPFCPPGWLGVPERRNPREVEVFVPGPSAAALAAQDQVGSPRGRGPPLGIRCVASSGSSREAVLSSVEGPARAAGLEKYVNWRVCSAARGKHKPGSLRTQKVTPLTAATAEQVSVGPDGVTLVLRRPPPPPPPEVFLSDVDERIHRAVGVACAERASMLGSERDRDAAANQARTMLKDVALESVEQSLRKLLSKSGEVLHGACAEPVQLWRVLRAELRKLVEALLHSEQDDPEAGGPQASPRRLRTVSKDERQLEPLLRYRADAEPVLFDTDPGVEIRFAEVKEGVGAESWTEVLKKTKFTLTPFNALAIYKPVKQFERTVKDLLGRGERPVYGEGFTPEDGQQGADEERGLADAVEGAVDKVLIPRMVTQALEIFHAVADAQQLGEGGLAGRTFQLVPPEGLAREGDYEKAPPVLEVVSQARSALEALLPLPIDLAFAKDSIQGSAASVVQALQLRLVGVLWEVLARSTACELIRDATKAAIGAIASLQPGAGSAPVVDAPLRVWIELGNSIMAQDGDGPGGPAELIRQLRDASRPGTSWARRLRYLESYQDIGCVAAITHSAEWLAEQIVSLAAKNAFTSSGQRRRRSSCLETSFPGALLHFEPGMSASLFSSSQAQGMKSGWDAIAPPVPYPEAKDAEGLYRQLLVVSRAAFLALEVDLQVRCFAMLDVSELGDIYNRQHDTVDPDTFVDAFNRELCRIHSVLGEYLPLSKRDALFRPLPRLVAQRLIRSIGQLKCKNITEAGFAQLKRNMYSIQQNFALLVGSDGDAEAEDPFGRTRLYFDLTRQTPHTIVECVRQQLQGVGAGVVGSGGEREFRVTTFSDDEYKAAIEVAFESSKSRQEPAWGGDDFARFGSARALSGPADHRDGPSQEQVLQEIRLHVQAADETRSEQPGSPADLLSISALSNAAARRRGSAFPSTPGSRRPSRLAGSPRASHSRRPSDLPFLTPNRRPAEAPGMLSPNSQLGRSMLSAGQARKSSFRSDAGQLPRKASMSSPGMRKQSGTGFTSPVHRTQPFLRR